MVGVSICVVFSYVWRVFLYILLLWVFLSEVGVVMRGGCL